MPQLLNVTNLLELYQWAIDGVAVVVNLKNKARALTSAQLIDIFAGKIDNWKAVGGEDQKISLYTRDEASGTREVFWEKGRNPCLMPPEPSPPTLL
jgi:phosphate transport system substrate-binding protein